MKKITIIFLIGLLTLTIPTGCGGEIAQGQEEEVIQVKTYQIEEKNIQKTIEITGQVEPIQSVQIKSHLNDEIGGLFVDIGDQVNPDKPLGFLIGNSIMQNVENARIALMNTRQNKTIADVTASLNLQQSENNLSKSRRAYELAQETYETTLKTNSSSMKEAEDAYKKTVLQASVSIDQARDGYQNTLDATSQQKEELTTMAEQGARSVITELDPYLEFADTILGVDNTSINDVFEGQLGAIDTLATYKLEPLYLKASKKLKEASDSFYSQNKPEDYLAKALEAAQATKELMDTLSYVLKNTFPSMSLPVEQLTSFRSQTNGAQSYVNGHIKALEQINNHLISSNINIKSQLDNAEANLKKAEENKEDKNESITIRLAGTQLEKARVQIEEQINRARTARVVSELDFKNAQKAYELAHKSNDNLQLTAKSQENSAFGQLALTLLQQEDLIITAPFKGVVTRKFANLGDQVSAGSPILEVSDVSSMKVVANINAEDARHLSLLQEVEIEGKKGFISKIAPSVGENTRKVRIEINAQELSSEVFAGSYVKVNISLDGILDSVSVPLIAVYISESEKSVFLVKDGLITKKTVEVGQILGNNIEIKSGLKIGDIVVVERGGFIEEGARVELSQKITPIIIPDEEKVDEEKVELRFFSSNSDYSKSPSDQN